MGVRTNLELECRTMRRTPWTAMATIPPGLRLLCSSRSLKAPSLQLPVSSMRLATHRQQHDAEIENDA